jgi:thiol-disulfide isomerase/thioredoxin
VKAPGRLVVALLAVAMAAVFAIVLARGRAGVRAADARCDGGSAGDCYPEITLVDTSGAAWPPDVIAGNTIIVNYWATWCRPCIDELPLLSSIYERRKAEGLRVFGVLVDGVDDAELAAFARRHDIRFPIVRADPALFEAFGGAPGGLPTSLFYDRRGRLAQRHLGPVQPEQLDTRLDQLLAR